MEVGWQNLRVSYPSPVNTQIGRGTIQDSVHVFLRTSQDGTLSYLITRRGLVTIPWVLVQLERSWRDRTTESKSRTSRRVLRVRRTVSCSWHTDLGRWATVRGSSGWPRIGQETQNGRDHKRVNSPPSFETQLGPLVTNESTDTDYRTFKGTKGLTGP